MKLIKKYQLKKIDKKTRINWVNPSNLWYGSWDCDKKKKKANHNKLWSPISHKLSVEWWNQGKKNRSKKKTIRIMKLEHLR